MRKQKIVLKNEPTLQTKLEIQVFIDAIIFAF